MIVIVQDIVTIWTKESRSGAGARRRSAVPLALPLPHRLPRGGERLILVHHQVRYAEAHDYQPERSDLDVEPIQSGRSIRIACAVVRCHVESVTVTWAWDRRCGAPERSAHPRDVVNLEPGSWGRLRWNGRSSSLFGMSGWRYRQHTLNVGLYDTVQGIEPFSGDPSQTFSGMADLR